MWLIHFLYRGLYRQLCSVEERRNYCEVRDSIVKSEECGGCTEVSKRKLSVRCVRWPEGFVNRTAGKLVDRIARWIGGTVVLWPCDMIVFVLWPCDIIVFVLWPCKMKWWPFVPLPNVPTCLCQLCKYHSKPQRPHLNITLAPSHTNYALLNSSEQIPPSAPDRFSVTQ